MVGVASSYWVAIAPIRANEPAGSELMRRIVGRAERVAAMWARRQKACQRKKETGKASMSARRESKKDAR